MLPVDPAAEGPAVNTLPSPGLCPRGYLGLLPKPGTWSDLSSPPKHYFQEESPYSSPAQAVFQKIGTRSLLGQTQAMAQLLQEHVGCLWKIPQPHPGAKQFVGTGLKNLWGWGWKVGVGLFFF